MTVVVISSLEDPETSSHINQVTHECSREGFVLDIECHFTTHKVDDWSPIRYGSKLWKAQDISCPELHKFVSLLQRLSPLYHTEQTGLLVNAS